VAFLYCWGPNSVLKGVLDLATPCAGRERAGDFRGMLLLQTQ
jgi:hypothetical protein